MASRNYVPRPGDIVWLNFDPQAGREQSGRRPALVLSPESYNKLTGLMICCPMTSKPKGRPFEVSVSESSAVLADHIKSIDWLERKAQFKEVAAKFVLDETKLKVNVLLKIK